MEPHVSVRAVCQWIHLVFELVTDATVHLSSVENAVSLHGTLHA
jgi:hypothetical protein